MYGHRVCVGSGTPTRAVTQTYEVTDLVIPSIGKWVLAYRFDRLVINGLGFLARQTSVFGRLRDSCSRSQLSSIYDPRLPGFCGQQANAIS